MARVVIAKTKISMDIKICEFVFLIILSSSLSLVVVVDSYLVPEFFSELPVLVNVKAS